MYFWSKFSNKNDMVSAWRNFKNIFPRPLFIIIFRPEMLKFHPYSILTGDTRVEFVISCVLSLLYLFFLHLDLVRLTVSISCDWKYKQIFFYLSYYLVLPNYFKKRFNKILLSNIMNQSTGLKSPLQYFRRSIMFRYFLLDSN